ncbi:MAG: hypothetical protein EBT89_01500, partial [Opitutaceae bacterium]|nr:hypothetical protein [Opitutaceae bacterium]
MTASSLSTLALLATLVGAGLLTAADSTMKAKDQNAAVPYCAPGDEYTSHSKPHMVKESPDWIPCVGL